jgi:hypothetical protein
MNRLQSELQRLYGASTEGGLRGIALELPAPHAWEHFAPLWQGVQSDLHLPAPGIAVSGTGYQLWFSLSQPVATQQALAFVDALRRRYLAGVPPERLRARPSDGTLPEITGMPPAERGEDRWAAFVAPDLAALFVDEPWLDLPPGSDAQAELLSRLQSMSPVDLQRVLAAPVAAPAPAVHQQDPRAFLLGVMNDGGVELALRIEAAKALLPYSEGQRRPAA